MRAVAALIVFHCSLFTASAQRFFNLTADEVKIDSVMPYFTYAIPLGEHYADSTYQVSIVYPEFINMSTADVLRYQKITSEQPPAMPIVRQQTVTERKRGTLEVFFVPVVWREGKYQKLVSFMLRLESVPINSGNENISANSGQMKHAPARASVSAASRYAEHSVLATGKWAKIRVPETGVYQLTESLIQKAGFKSLGQVRIYGYGGELQPEKLTGEYLTATDDLKEVPTCSVGGKRLFHAQGPVSWSDPKAKTRIRNPYSNYGYYFITEGDTAPLSVDSATFIGSFYGGADDYHVLREIDNYAWYQGGRNLYEDTPISIGTSKSFTIELPANVLSGSMTVKLSAEVSAKASIELNGTDVGTMSISRADSSNDRACESTAYFDVEDLKTSNSIKITTTDGGPIRPDFISFCLDKPKPRPDLLNGTFDEPEYVYNITPQDHHADTPVDMVIVVPLTGKLNAQAERLKAFHEQNDSLIVRIVPADELYNEFSSGTPDANAYRRYMKMFYDRAENENELPRYLLLFGDCAWDNRMLSIAWRSESPDDFLLCYESENSFSDTDCFVSDDFFCMLDDEESIAEGTGYYSITGKADIAVGRFTVRNELQAQTLVDKTINYAKNQNAGSWQNTIMVMGDDGNNNLHMRDANEAANEIEKLNGGLVVKRVMWDAYNRETTATGNSYPEITKIVKQQQAEGALVMDYCGHGRWDQISHEGVLHLSDFEAFSNANLPLWITASCDIMPFDGQVDNIGESAILNEKGGAVAFFGTSRTVYADRNKYINIAFLKELLNTEGEKRISLGEAQRRAKNKLISTSTDRTRNKLQYSLLGDPALCLNIPVLKAVIDTINGQPVSSTANIALKAGSVASVKGHIEKQGSFYPQFNGTVTALVRDTKEHIVCKLNNTSNDGASEAFEYDDRTKTLFTGSDKVKEGRFGFSFAVPLDINYSDDSGLINIYAVNEAKNEEANGYCDQFKVGGTQIATNDSIGPSVYCYLNSPSFTNGGNVNSTPYFVAEITDKDGINTSGSSIGHDLELCIDGEMARTYILNDNFQYEFGSYTTGKTFYSIPELPVGKHTLRFRAWDILNNSTTTELSFNVVKGLEPNCFSVACTNNPATTQTTFIISHDRTGSTLDVEIDVFDFAGRQLWHHSESGTAASGTYTVGWDLCTSGGARLETGVYLYRARISSDGSSKSSKAQKIIILNNN
ncbi:MAG: type IX secretion system sortase PorU [Prevotella sp.]|nr:type IX secretion system sortase PorU [Prevotella sp.]